MNVEQIFYGRGPDGYAMLGASVPSCGLTDQVLELCQSVGTPGFEREDDNQPFLLQKVCGANVLMACGRNGDLDSLGRKTLFFHVVVVPLAFVKEQKISAVDLYRADVFSTKCRAGKLSALTIDGVKGELAGEADSRFKFPAVFSCRRANNLALVSLLCGNLVGTNWATMCWRVMSGFDWFGLDESWGCSRIPANYAVYDGEGRLRRTGGDRTDVSASGADAASRSSEEKKASATSEGAESRKGGGVKKSIVLCLVGVVIGLGIGRGIWGNAETKAVPRDQSAGGAQSSQESSRQEFVAEAPQTKVVAAQPEKPWPVFNEEWRIHDFKREMKNLDATYVSAVIDNPTDIGLKNERALFKKLEGYVNFVNEHFGKTQKDKKETK